jgi:divalent metal cation (Fe/Co/Zn/Cd) transporter
LGFLYGDALAAGGVACFIAIAGWRLGKRTLDTLLDVAPKGRRERIKALAESVAGVVAVESVRLRPGGNEVFGEVVVAVSRALPLEQVTGIKTQLSEVVVAEFPDTILTVIVRPRALDSETICERVVLVAQRQRLMIHHVTVQDVDGQLSISFDVEVDGRTSLDTAHDNAEAFKKVLQQEFGADTEVEPHVEPMEIDPLEGKNASADEVEKVADALRKGAEGSNLIWEIHDVRVRECARGLIVNYHCRASGELTVAAVHEHMDEIERRVREAYPRIIRIVGHADVRQCSRDKRAGE